MAEEKSQEKWQGKFSSELKGPTAKQVWPLLEDFCNFHKWHPTIDTCYQVVDQGPTTEAGTGPGLIRYCGATTTSPSGESVVSWAKERLIGIDPAQRRLSYEVLDNNVGFKRWVATFEVVPVEGGGACEIRWSFEGEAPEGWSYESLVSYYESTLQGLAKKMEHALMSSPV